MDKTILEMNGITKRFPGVLALDDVNLTVQKATIHSIVGENGAGKSTLMKVLSGVYSFEDFDGSIVFKNRLCEFENVRDSEKAGIAIIHQELALVPTMSICENIFLGNEIKKNGKIDWAKQREISVRYMGLVGLNEEPDTLIKDIGVGKRQLVEIAKALSKNVDLLILDEPTASLNDKESKELLKLLDKLKNENKLTSILISHKLNEVMMISDFITVIRDGKTIISIDVTKNKVDEDRIVEYMVGREISDLYPKRDSNPTDISIEVKNWTVYKDNYKKLKNINFYARKGEIIGISGLMGSGRTELALSIFGRSYGDKISGEIIINGKKQKIKNISEAINVGIGYVTEDRKELGLLLEGDVKTNIILANLKSTTNGITIDFDKEQTISEYYVNLLNIKCNSLATEVENLSGGNQQKVMLARWIHSNTQILILDEPTRGVDVGAKFEIYNIINQLVEEGKTIILISSELPEVLGMSDRIYVMDQGKIIKEFDKKEATQEKIMASIVSNKENLNEY